jgi:hypothetical protein
MNLRLLLALALLPAAAPAAPRSSASYTIATDTADAGGKRATSAAYTNDGSAGGIAGLSTVAAPAETAKHGYLGQLYDVTGLTLTAVSLNVNETATDQLGAWQVLDDATFLAVPATSVAWSVASGPLTGISTGGLATAGSVYQDTPANAQGIYLGQTGSLGLTVKNVNLDDFGSYAGDGLDDAWQNQYFGLNNPNAAPAADPDGDGQTNLFEFTAGLIPTDPQSRFTFTIQSVPGQPTQKKLIFAPRLTDRTYVIKAKASLLVGSYLPLANPSTPSDSGQERTITDLSATGAMKLYQVEITKP